MEQERLNQEIEDLISLYDPDLANYIYPDELPRILYAIESYKAGYLLPIQLERQGWLSGPGKYERIQTCLGNAVRQTLGSELERISGTQDDPLAGLAEYHKYPVLLALAKKDRQAKIYCAIGYYFQAIRSLVNYPEIDKRAVVEALNSARRLLPCPELDRAVEKVNGIFGPDVKDALVLLTVLLCMVVIIITSSLIVDHLSNEHSAVEVTPLQNTSEEEQRVAEVQPGVPHSIETGPRVDVFEPVEKVQSDTSLSMDTSEPEAVEHKENMSHGEENSLVGSVAQDDNSLPIKHDQQMIAELPRNDSDHVRLRPPSVLPDTRNRRHLAGKARPHTGRASFPPPSRENL